MRLPNGYGSVYKLSGKRRKPFVARITEKCTYSSDTKKGKLEYRVLGYYETRALALQKLADFHNNPYSIDAANITFAEVYEKWSEKKFIIKDADHLNGISESNVKAYKASYSTCKELHSMKFVDIKLIHLQKIVDKSGKNHPTLRKLKVLFGQLFEYAVMHEIITKERDIAEYVDISGAGNPNSLDREPFTKLEVKSVWSWSSTSEYIQIILMLIYNGVRVSEFLDLKKENVNLNERWFKVIDSKTKSGIRTVPISDKTFKFYEYWFTKNACEYLVSTPDGNHFEYRNYYDSYWKPFIEQMNMKHTPHSTRYTCISFLTAVGVDARVIKKIVGHKGQGVTEQVYTKLEIDELLNAINKI